MQMSRRKLVASALPFFAGCVGGTGDQAQSTDPNKEFSNGASTGSDNISFDIIDRRVYDWGSVIDFSAKNNSSKDLEGGLLQIGEDHPYNYFFIYDLRSGESNEYQIDIHGASENFNPGFSLWSTWFEGDYPMEPLGDITPNYKYLDIDPRFTFSPPGGISVNDIRQQEVEIESTIYPRYLATPAAEINIGSDLEFRVFQASNPPAYWETEFVAELATTTESKTVTMGTPWPEITIDDANFEVRDGHVDRLTMEITSKTPLPVLEPVLILTQSDLTLVGTSGRGDNTYETTISGGDYTSVDGFRLTRKDNFFARHHFRSERRPLLSPDGEENREGLTQTVSIPFGTKEGATGYDVEFPIDESATMKIMIQSGFSILASKEMKSLDLIEEQ